MFRTLSTTLIVLLVVTLAGVSLSLAGGSKIKKDYDPGITAADFEDGSGDPYPIDNRYSPLVPGTTFVYEAGEDDELETNVVCVTHDTKEILGVNCTVVTDVAYEGGDAETGLLVEETTDWYAQDADGNVWYFGEATTAYEYDDDGNIIGESTEGSWEAGVNDALPGIVMEAAPRAGDRYRQEYLEDVAEDMALVMRLNASVSNFYGDYDDCLETKEWSPLEHGAVEHKYYAPGVGLVLVNELRGKTKRVELVEIATE